MHFSTLTLITLTTTGSVLASPLQGRVASASCTGHLVANPPQQFICNQEGRLTATDGFLGTTAKNSVKSAEDCYQQCYAMSGKSGSCKTFSYNKAAGSCAFYSESIKSQQFVADDSTGNVFYNSAHCWKNTCTTPKPVKTSTSSTKTKSTKTKTTKTKTTSTKMSTTSEKSTKTKSTTLQLPTTTSIVLPTTTSVALPTIKTKTKTSTSKPVMSSTSSTSSAPSAAPTCSTPNLSVATCNMVKVSVSSSLLTYSSYFSGSGLTETPNNPSNVLGLLHTTTTFPGTQDACEAVVNCAAKASALGLANLAMSFDLHFVDQVDGTDACDADGSNGVWQCVTYSGVNSDQSVFSVTNASVPAVFGYSGALQIL